MPNFLLETFPKVLSIKSWSSSLHFTSWNILSKTLLFRNMSLFLRGGWVVKFLTLSHFCHMSLLGGGGWVLKEIWSMSLNNPFFFFVPFPNDFLLSPPVIYELWTSSFALIAFGKVLLYVLNQSIPAIVIGLPESIIALAPFSRILLSLSLVLKQRYGLLLRTPNLHEHCYLLRCWIAHCPLPSSSWTSCQLPEDKWTTQFLRPTHWEYLKALVQFYGLQAHLLTWRAWYFEYLSVFPSLICSFWFDAWLFLLPSSPSGFEGQLTDLWLLQAQAHF